MAVLEADFLAEQGAEVLAVPAVVSLLMNVWRIARSIWMNAKVLALRAEECQAVVVFLVVEQLEANFLAGGLLAVNFQAARAAARAKKNALLIARTIRKIAEVVASREADRVVDFLVNAEILRVPVMQKNAPNKEAVGMIVNVIFAIKA